MYPAQMTMDDTDMFVAPSVVVSRNSDWSGGKFPIYYRIQITLFCRFRVKECLVARQDGRYELQTAVPWLSLSTAVIQKGKL